jgi:4-hydroxybenzoate polyprenyltransferase
LAAGYLSQYRPSFLIETTLFLFLVTIVIYRYLYRLKKLQLFVQVYLGTLVLKIIIYGSYTVGMMVMNRTGSMENVFYFLIVYFVFTALEVGFLYRRISSP